MQLSTFAIYADGSTLHVTGKNLNQIRKNLEIDFMILHKWFFENIQKKFHYMVIGRKDPLHKVTLNNNEIPSSTQSTLTCSKFTIETL